MVSKEELEKILPEWSVYAEAEDMFELSRHSPQGEEVLLDIQGKTLDELSDSAFQVYDEFDADDHASEIYHAKHHGDENAVASMRARRTTWACSSRTPRP